VSIRDAQAGERQNSPNIGSEEEGNCLLVRERLRDDARRGGSRHAGEKGGKKGLSSVKG